MRHYEIYNRKSDYFMLGDERASRGPPKGLVEMDEPQRRGREL